MKKKLATATLITLIIMLIALMYIMTMSGKQKRLWI